jgi:hypothetical protein
MKKSFLFALTSLAALQLGSAQTISVTGTSGNITAGGTFDSTITLSISGANSINNVESLNMLLGTPSSGINSGAGLFTVFVNSLVSPFDNKNSGSASGNQSSFATAGDANNLGNSISTTSLDLGANASAPITVASTGTTNIGVDVLRFTASPSILPGTYNFFITSGGVADTAQGSWIRNSAGTPFNPTAEPVFTITVVPEPSTWALIAFGGAGVFALQVLRLRRRA